MDTFLIVGLGNIGAEYVHTRHNAGFLIVDALAKNLALSWSSNRYAYLCEGRIKNKKILLLKPSTFMNESGKAVDYWMKKHQLKPHQLLIITDDLHLDFPRLRYREKGGTGGHNGLKSVQAHLLTEAYPRLRFGIGAHFEKGAQVAFVLGAWSAQERALLHDFLPQITETLKAYVLHPQTGAQLFNSLSYLPSK